jgi:hypothetical protein
VDFTDDDFAAIRKARQNNGTLWAVLGGVGVLALLVGQCSPSTAPSDVTSANGTNVAGLSDDAMIATNAALDSAAAADPSPASSWSYSRRRDEVRNGEIVEATIRSTNTTNLEFPYGEVGLTITVRQHPEWGRDVIFIVDEGQILCRIRDCSGTINIDGKAQRLSLNESGDNDSSVVFASDGPGMIAKLKKARRVIVELPFFQNGNRQFTFDTAGLEWPPKKPAAPAISGPPAGEDPLCDPKQAKSVGGSCD